MPKAQQLHTFVVAGSGFFPLDMLRYDRCEVLSGDVGPQTHAELRITGERFDERLCRREITVRHLPHPAHATPTITIARWKSFGWDVVRAI